MASIPQPQYLMANAEVLSKLTGYNSFFHQLDQRIQPLRCTKERLEGSKYDILNFTTQFCGLNGLLGHLITRVVVEFFWTSEVWRLYPSDHPEKRRLIGQTHSPKYEVYWQKKLDVEAFKAKRVRQSSADIWSSPRQLSKEERKDKGVVLLGNHDWEYTLPEVQLMPLYQVFFLDLAKKIRAANPGKRLSIELMRRLWRLLIREVYDFVNEAERTAKLQDANAVTDEEFEDATRSVLETLSKKRSVSSESGSEAEPSKSQSGPSKRRKIVRFAGTEGSNHQTGDLKPQSSTDAEPPTATHHHQPVTKPDSLVQDAKILELNGRIANLAAKLATAEQQVAEYEKAKQKWKSQRGQLLAAEQQIRELRQVKPNLARHLDAKYDALKAKDKAERRVKKNQSGLLRLAEQKAAKLEYEARERKVARLASLAKVEGGFKAKEPMEAGVDVSYE